MLCSRARERLAEFCGRAGLPIAAAALMAGLLLLWLGMDPGRTLDLRVPGTDQPPGAEGPVGGNPVLNGRLIPGEGQPADLPGAWPGFRGPDRTGIASAATGLARAWPASGPRMLWSVELGEGYAGAAIQGGRVYLMDYDREKKQDALRCLSLADGKEIWRFVYPVSVKRNHGMSRTTPAVTEKHVVAMGPKCHVVCLDAVSGKLQWGLDLARDFGTTVPPWYAGQCPLIDGDSVILAPGGKDALLMAVALDSGDVRWRSPNPNGWKMTHSSVTPIEVDGHRQYVYCAHLGVVGVSARDGSLLWQTTDWKISIATVPSPVAVDARRVFLSGGYEAGSMMLEIVSHEGQWQARPLFRLESTVFGAEQHTPILFHDYLYGMRTDGRFVCLALDGKVAWASDASQPFGRGGGAYLLADGLIYALDDHGRLTMMEATPVKFMPLAHAQVLQGRESWGPMALAGTRLLARDLTSLVCLEVGAP